MARSVHFALFAASGQSLYHYNVSTHHIAMIEIARNYPTAVKEAVMEQRKVTKMEKHKPAVFPLFSLKYPEK